LLRETIDAWRRAGFFEGAGNYPQADMPEETAAVVLGFLAGM